jgi:hypothetical protein
LSTRARALARGGGAIRGEAKNWIPLEILAEPAIVRSMPSVPLQKNLVEFFLLRDAERGARAYPPDALAALAQGLALAAQKREAAELLWPRGNQAEALAMAKSAFAQARSAVESFAAAAPSPVAPWLPRAESIIADACAATDGVELPPLDTEVTSAHAEIFRAFADAVLDLDNATRYSREGLLGVTSLRRKRAVTGAITALALLFVAGWSLRVPTFSRAVASDEWSPGEDSAKRAIDGDPATGWFLPDGRSGWIDLTLSKPRGVQIVRVAQGNPPWNDRSTKDARIETFLGSRLVKGVDVTLAEPPSKEVGWTEVRIDSPVCDRIRFSVKSSYKRGGGLDELEVKK